jgi:hypothetical protein
MTPFDVVTRYQADILAIISGSSSPHVGERARPLLDRLLADVPMPAVPAELLAAPRAAASDYAANWSHQVWYHLTELARIREGRKERAQAQGGDSWVNVSAPDPDEELTRQLRELAKLRALLAAMPRLVRPVEQGELVNDPLLDRPGAWEFPEGLAVERDSELGVCWTGQNPGGDWFWLRQPLPDAGVAIRVDLKPVSTIKGGLIAAFCVKPLKPGTPLSVASSPNMGDYFRNFDAYHFSVNRGASGYCNLRRAGPGLIMLASFPDPCPEYGRWYALEIIQRGPQVQLAVDGRLAVCYVDLGCIQPPLAGGLFGLRHFQGFCGWHRNLRVARLG